MEICRTFQEILVCAMSLWTKYNVTVKDSLPSLLCLLVKDFQNEEESPTISRTKENDA